jgi:hypothetical protein
MPLVPRPHGAPRGVSLRLSDRLGIVAMSNIIRTIQAAVILQMLIGAKMAHKGSI